MEEAEGYFSVGRVEDIAFNRDYSSALSRILKEKHGQSFVSMFKAGNCVDISHLNTNHVPWDEFRYWRSAR